MATVIARRVVEDGGTIVVFEGTPEGEPDKTVLFAVDHRMAQAIADALSAEGEAPCAVEAWQIL